MQIELDEEKDGKVKNLKNAIEGDYRHHWIIDNLPAASLVESAEVRLFFVSTRRDLSDFSVALEFHWTQDCAHTLEHAWLKLTCSPENLLNA